MGMKKMQNEICASLRQKRTEKIHSRTKRKVLQTYKRVSKGKKPAPQ